MECYLTFVIAARNDNYGGDFLRRMQAFLNALFALRSQYKLDAELVVVEWNPPDNRPRLRDAIAWPNSMGAGRIRIIEVPSDIHQQLPNSKRMPMFEYIAKNVGIRRARGKYVLATNPDIIFSSELIRFFASRRLRGDSFYRVDRYDVPKEVPLELPVARLLRFCARNVSFVHRREGSILVPSFRDQLRRNLRRLSPRRLARGLVWHAGKIFSREVRSLPDHQPSRWPLLHTNASGDFLLMAKAQWCALRGFPELLTHSHIDSYLAFTAAVAGLKEVIVPYRIYHQEHDRAEHASRPLTALWEIPELKRMIETKHLEVVNGEDWGLGGVELTTTETS